MKNRYLFYFRYVLGLFVFLFLLSFLIQTGYGEEFRNQRKWKPGFGKKEKLLGKNLQRVREAIRVHKMNSEWLMDIAGVVGTATGLGVDGEPEIRVFTTKAGVPGIPKRLDGFSVKAKVTGKFYAFGCVEDPSTRCEPPAPIGVSTGHPAITAGTIGARVTRDRNSDGFPDEIYALSNNHIFANMNTASIGDPILQPSAYDGGTAGPDPNVVDGDEIGTLAEFVPIDFCYPWWFYWICPDNTVDAAIAATRTDLLGNSTALSYWDEQAQKTVDGYGMPNWVIHPAFGDPNVFSDHDDQLTQLLGMPVMKFGRTTKMTYGQISEINATINVQYCYDPDCFNYDIARFVDQIIITPGTFSAGGDSGSLIVSYDEFHGFRFPVGLLFAGSTVNTVANRIDRVLYELNVEIDGCEVEPTVSIEDVEVMEGSLAELPVSLSHRSKDYITIYFNTLSTIDATNSATPGDDYEPISDGFVTFEPGDTRKTIRVTIIDDNDPEDQEEFYVDVTDVTNATIPNGSIVGTVTIEDNDGPEPPILNTMHVGDLDGESGYLFWGFWWAGVYITVHDTEHYPVAGATIYGTFDDGPSVFQCTTNGSGWCYVEGYQRRRKCLTFSVFNVSHASLSYASDNNHDVDGGTNGTSIKVCK